MNWFKKLFKKEETIYVIYTPDLYEIQGIVRKFNNNYNLTDSGYAKEGKISFDLDGCMSWSSARIRYENKVVYYAYKGPNSNFELEYYWKDEVSDDIKLEVIKAIKKLESR